MHAEEDGGCEVVFPFPFSIIGRSHFFSLRGGAYKGVWSGGVELLYMVYKGEIDGWKRLFGCTFDGIKRDFQKGVVGYWFFVDRLSGFLEGVFLCWFKLDRQAEITFRAAIQRE